MITTFILLYYLYLIKGSLSMYMISDTPGGGGALTPEKEGYLKAGSGDLQPSG